MSPGPSKLRPSGDRPDTGANPERSESEGRAGKPRVSEDGIASSQGRSLASTVQAGVVLLPQMSL